MKHSFRTNEYLRKIKAFYEFLASARRTKFGALMKLISENDIEFVIDIGANVGQFALDLRKAGYLGEILFFEPVSNTFVILRRKVTIDELTPASIADGIIKVLQGDGAAFRKAAIEATRDELDWSKIALQWKALVTSLA